MITSKSSAALAAANYTTNSSTRIEGTRTPSYLSSSRSTLSPDNGLQTTDSQASTAGQGAALRSVSDAEPTRVVISSSASASLAAEQATGQPPLAEPNALTPSGPSEATDDADAGPNSESAAQESEAKARLEQQQEREQQLEINALAARDREVRAHERAHAAVGGQYAGAPRYEFERGPDGVSYAISGEVSIDTSKGATPQETLQKAQTIRRAALAPAEPSPQDRRVAAQASQMEAEALREISAERQQVAQENRESAAAEGEQSANNASDDAGQTAATNNRQLGDIGLAPTGISTSVGSRSSSNTIDSGGAEARSVFSSSGSAPVNSAANYISQRLQQTIASTAPDVRQAGQFFSQFV